jgi:hypothetical protein
MSHLSRPLLSLALTALGSLSVALACGVSETGSSSNCDADVPDGWTCTTSLSVEQSECQGDGLSSDAETSVAASDGQGVMISGGHFRCAQEVCAYLDESAETPRLLLQPCDMDPDSVAKCDCLYGLEVDVEVPAEGLDVYSRSDNWGGVQEPILLGQLPAAENEDVDAEPERLCDGSSKLRFATQNAGGNLTGVPRVSAEVGWSFFLIDGQCRYWVSAGGEVHFGTLSPAEEEELTEDLLLGRWSELGGSNLQCSDASTVGLRYYDERYSLYCASNELTEAVDDWRIRLYDAGAPLDGAVRYTLADATESAWAMTIPEYGQSWTLAWDPATQAVGQMEDEMAEPHVADGEDAAALRALRTSYAENMPASGLGPWLRVPVVYESDGTEAHYFDLALRDVTPFEIDGELDVDAFFE